MKLKKDFIIDIIFKLLYLSILAYATIEIIAGGLSLPYSGMTVLFFIIGFNIIVQMNIKYFRIAIAVFFMVLIFISREEIMAGFQMIANEAGSLLETFYGIHLNTIDAPADSANLTASFVLCAVVLSNINRLAILKFKSSWLLFLPGGLLIAGLMLIGMIPSASALLAYMIGGIGTCLVFRKYKNTRLHNNVMLLISGLMALLLIISVFAIYPLFKPAESSLYMLKREITDFYKNKNLYFYEDDAGSESLSGMAVGGLAKGDLRNTGNLRFSGKNHLEVTVDEKPENRIYLKGYVAGNYKENQWEPHDYTSFNELFSGNGYDPESVKMVIWNMPVNTFVNIGMPQMIEIKNLGVGTVIYPYTADLSTDYSLSGDENVTMGDWSGDTFEYYPRFYSLPDDGVMVGGYYQEMFVYDEENDILINTPGDGIFSLYNEYVVTEYMENVDEIINQEEWAEVEAYVNAGLIDDGYSTQTLIRLIRDYLRETTSYDLNPGKVPDGQDFVEYFLFNNKKGFCVHYATAATMMFRYYDIPARYVEGYVVAPGDFKENDDGTYTAVVKDNRAHAWSEVYSKEYGWIPIEVTPSYTEGQIPGENQSTEATNESLRETKDSETETVKKSKNTAAAPEIKKENTAIVYILITILIIMAIAGLIIIRRYMIRNNRCKKLYSKDNRESICTCYEEIVKLLKFREDEYDTLMSEEAYAQKVEDRFEFLEKGEFIHLTKIILKSTYSQHEPSNKDKAYALNLYKKLRKEIDRRSGIVRKLWLRWIQCL